ncbi:hypothetical protein D3C87_1859610 [compost metagenome]
MELPATSAQRIHEYFGPFDVGVTIRKIFLGGELRKQDSVKAVLQGRRRQRLRHQQNAA